MRLVNVLILVVACAATLTLGIGVETQRREDVSLEGGVGTPNTAARSSTKPVERLRDAGGVTVPAHAYQRILSASTAMDRALLALVSRDRIVALTAYSIERDAERHRMAGIPSLKQLDDLEQVLSLRPDLILMNGYGDVGRIQRLRDQGLAVFDLGREQGFAALLDDIRMVGQLVGVPERAERYAEQLHQQMTAIAADLPEPSRKTAIYLSPAGDRIYGGTEGSHQFDILTFAGLRDVAANDHHGFPDYRIEDILAYSPDVVLTKKGSGALLCLRPGLAEWPPCLERHRIVELEESLLDTGGPAMVDAARELRHRVYPRPD